MRKRQIEYRGFTILIFKRPTWPFGAYSWSATWEEETGATRGRAMMQNTDQDALDTARRAIDRYHRKIDGNPHAEYRG